MTRLGLLARSSRGHFWIVSSMLVGYGPGFILPFLMAATLRPEVSDSILLAFSIAITVGSTLGLAIENAWAASVAEHLSSGGALIKTDLTRGVQSAFWFSVKVGIVLLAAFGLGAILVNANSWRSTLVFLVLITPFPAISGAASVLNGVLNAQGRVALGIALQGVRGVFPLFGLAVAIVFDAPSLVLIALVVGELLRLVISFMLVAGTAGLLETSAVRQGLMPPTAGAMLHHSLGLSVLGTAPIVDRLFLASAGPGYVTLLEMCDRFFFAGSQVGNNLFVLPRVRKNADDLKSKTVRHVAISEIVRTTVLGCALAMTVVVLLFLARAITPAIISADVFVWTAVLMISLPITLGGTTATRLLVSTRNTKYIPYLSVLGMSTNVVGNVVGLALIGPIGVLWATVLSRLLMSGASLTILACGPTRGGNRKI